MTAPSLRLLGALVLDLQLCFKAFQLFKAARSKLPRPAPLTEGPSPKFMQKRYMPQRSLQQNLSKRDPDVRAELETYLATPFCDPGAFITLALENCCRPWQRGGRGSIETQYEVMDEIYVREMKRPPVVVNAGWCGNAKRSKNRRDPTKFAMHFTYSVRKAIFQRRFQ